MLLADLIKGCQKRNQYCFRLLYEQYSRMVYISLLHKGFDKEVVNSLTSDIFLHIWYFSKEFKVGSIRSESEVEKHFRNWIFQIARWKMASYYRVKNSPKVRFQAQFKSLEAKQQGADYNDKSILETYIPSVNGVEQKMIKEERELLINEASKALSFQEQQVIVLRVFEEYTYEDITDIIGEDVRASTLRKRFNRAVNKLRDIIITNILDQYLIVSRDGQGISREEYLEGSIYGKECFSDLQLAVEEEQNWMAWFERHKTSLVRTGVFDLNKKKNQLIWKHFIDKQTYREIAGKVNRAYQLRNTIKNNLIKLKSFTGGDLNDKQK